MAGDGHQIIMHQRGMSSNMTRKSQTGGPHPLTVKKKKKQTLRLGIIKAAIKARGPRSQIYRKNPPKRGACKVHKGSTAERKEVPTGKI